MSWDTVWPCINRRADADFNSTTRRASGPFGLPCLRGRAKAHIVHITKMRDVAKSDRKRRVLGADEEMQ